MASWRRRLTRLFGWLIAAFASFVATVVLALVVYLIYFGDSTYIEQRLESELSRMTGGTAVIGSIDLDLPSLSFELNEIVVAGSDPDIRLLQVERIWGSFRLSDMARMRLHFRALVVQGLILRLVEDPDGGFHVPGVESLPTPSLAPALGAGLSFSADRVSLEGASLVVANERVPWQLDASDLGFSLEGDGRDNYKGRVSYESGTLSIRDYPPTEGSASADIELAAGELLVHEASGESDVGSITARGKLNMAGGVTGRFDVTARGDLGRVSASILGVADGPLEGEATFRGTLSVGANDDALEGTFGLARGRVLGVALDDWTGEVFWDRQLLQVPLAQGEIGGGRARLQLHQALPLAEHDGSLDVDLAGASLTRLLQRSGAPESPVEALVEGSASLTFSSSTPLEPSGAFELSGVPPSAPTPGSESFAFEVSGRIDAGDVEISASRFEGADLVASLRGTYPRVGEAELRVDVASGDLGRLDSLAVGIRTGLRGPDEAAPEAWNIDGRGSAHGILTGRFPHPTFAGEVMAGPLSYAGLSLDDVRGVGTLSRDALELGAFTGRRADGVVSGSGRLALSGPSDTRGFDVRLRADRWPAFELSAAFAGSAPLEGLIDGDIVLTRTERRLDGEGRFVVTDGQVAGVSFDLATAKALFSGNRTRLEDVRVIRSGVPLEGRLELESSTGQITGEIRTLGFPLAGIELAGVPVDGTLDADGRVSGTLEEPLVEVTGQGRDFQLGPRSLGDGVLDASVREGLFSFSLELGERISVTATAGLDGAPPLRGRVDFEELDAGPWVARVSQPLSEATRLLLTGTADFEAEPGGARGIRVDARVARVALEASDRRLVSLAPIAARYQDGTLHIPSLSLVEGDDRIEAGGTVDFRGEQLDVRAEGNVQLAILSTLYPGIAATGGVDLSARVSGAWESPSFAGHADLDGNSLRFAGFAQAVGGLRGRVVFDNRTIRIPALEGVFGSGPIQLSGAMSLEGMRTGAIDVQVRGTGMRLRYPEGLVANLDADLSLLGNRDEQVLSGEVTLNDAVWSREYDLVSGVLSDSEGFVLFDSFEGDELFEDLRFDVRIVAPQSLRLRNSIAELDASADLELRGSLREPVLLGSTQAERGEIYLLGQRYDITSGKVDFVDPNRIEPFIELTAETRVRSYRVELRLTGTSQRFSPELSSDPPLRTVDILRLLSGASERDLGGNLVGNEEEELVGVGVASLLTERLSQEVGRRAERLFGLDRFSIDPFLVGRIANPTARVSLGKQITRDLSINYSTNLNSTTEAVILIEYTPEGNVSWILSRDDEGDIGIDVKFRKSF